MIEIEFFVQSAFFLRLNSMYIMKCKFSFDLFITVTSKHYFDICKKHG